MSRARSMRGDSQDPRAATDSGFTASSGGRRAIAMEATRVMRCIWPLVFGVACATEDYDPEQDLGDLEGIEEVGEGLTDLSSQCTFTASTGLMALTLDNSEIALVN